jgi:hypothetical protein
MAYPFPSSSEPFTQPALIARLRRTFEDLPDARRSGGNTRHAMADAALSAFSVFFLQSPSFLAWQKSMQDSQGRNNVQSLFGVHSIPSDNQSRNLLDSISPDHFYPLFRYAYQGLESTDHLNAFRALKGGLLLALDGAEYFSSTQIHCGCCSTQLLKDGQTRYFHAAITPVIVAPDQRSVIPLAPEFVTLQDGADKQDSELAAAKRWLAREAGQLPPTVTVLGDDLYCHQPFCEQIRRWGWHFVLVCKPSSHKTLYEGVEELERLGQVRQVKQRRWTGKQHLTEQYRFVNQVSLRQDDKAMEVNWCEVRITDKQGKTLYYNAFATDHLLNEGNVQVIVQAGRCRWKSENENDNTLKTKGYRVEHNFGHGQRHLAAVLATLILLAYLFHTVLEWFDACYRLLRQRLPSRQTFFDDIRALHVISISRTGDVCWSSCSVD